MSSTTLGNIVRIGQPSRSALRVASLRAVHQLLDEPIVLPDPVALPILGPETEAALRDDPFVLNDPMSRGLRGALVVRSRFAEDEVARAVAAGVRQYVVLGAGLDTFAYRNPHAAAGLRVFEVDAPSTQQWKRERLAAAGIAVPESMAFVPVDFERDELIRSLERAGFRADQPACLSLMGVTMYLSIEAIHATLAPVAALPKGSSITFDYKIVSSHLNPIDRVITEVLGQQIAAEGEPWVSSFVPEALKRDLLERGFSAVDDPTPEEIHDRYLARRKDGLRGGTSIRLVRARV